MTPYIVRASLTDAGTQVTDTDFITKADLSPDGKYLAFLAPGTTLEPGTPAPPFGALVGYWYVKNLETGSLVRVPLEAFLAEFPGFQPQFFEPNFEVVLGKTEGTITYGRFAFTFDLDTGAMLQSYDVPKDPSSSFSPTAVTVGTTDVIFGSTRSYDLTSGTTNERFSDIYIIDTDTKVVSVLQAPLNVYAAATFGTTTITYSESATPVAASTAGRYVGMAITVTGIKATNPGFAGGTIAMDFAVYDRVTQTFDRLTNNAPAAVAAFTDTKPFLDPLAIQNNSYGFSDTGRFMVISTGLALEADDTNGKSDIYLADGDTGLVTRISEKNGGQLTGNSAGADISGDGRFVVFHSDATELGASAAFVSDLYILDRKTGEIRQINITLDGSNGFVSRRAVDISQDGRFVTFFAIGTQYVAGDTNGREDVFRAANPFLADKIPTPGDDTLNGGSGRDRINALSGDDLVNGLAGNDLLTGGFGRDSLKGGTGDDVLDGGRGRDFYEGGTGADVFLFRAAADLGKSLAGADSIQDFRRSAGDKIDLHLIDAKPGTAADDPFTFAAGGLTGRAGQITYDATSRSLQGDLNGDGTADFYILVNAAIRAGDLDL